MAKFLRCERPTRASYRSDCQSGSRWNLDADMRKIGGDPGVSQATREYECVQDVAELGAAEDLEPAIAVGRIQVVEVELGALVGVRRDAGHPRWRRSAQPFVKAVS